MKLQDLKPGDKFYPASQAEKRTPIFQVIYHSLLAGGVICENLQTSKRVVKRRKLEVIKTK